MEDFGGQELEFQWVVCSFWVSHLLFIKDTIHRSAYRSLSSLPTSRGFVFTTARVYFGPHIHQFAWAKVTPGLVSHQVALLWRCVTFWVSRDDESGRQSLAGCEPLALRVVQAASTVAWGTDWTNGSLSSPGFRPRKFGVLLVYFTWNPSSQRSKKLKLKENRLRSPKDLRNTFSLPVVLHKVVAKFQRWETYRRGALLWYMDGTANPLMDRIDAALHQTLPDLLRNLLRSGTFSPKPCSTWPGSAPHRLLYTQTVLHTDAFCRQTVLHTHTGF